MTTAQDGRRDRLVLVDGSGYIWRAFHAVPPRFAPGGEPVNAVYGLVAHLLVKLATAGRASHAAVVFDPPGPSFRSDLHPGYKANRPPAPEALTRQLPLTRAAAAAFAIPALEAPGYEADDLIASYTATAVAAGLAVSIVSSDKDLMQLVDDAAGVSIYHPQKRTVLREADVVAAFGVPPARVPDVQALAGDPADGLAGAPGIGRKIGADLIRRFGDLEALLARLDEVPQSKRRARLRESADSVRLTRRLVALDAQAPRPLPLEALRRRPLDRDAVQGFLARTGIEVTLPAT